MTKRELKLGLSLFAAVLFYLSTPAYAFKVCKSDFEVLCKGMEFNETNVRKCFADKGDKLTGQCKQYFTALTGSKKPKDKDKKEEKMTDKAKKKKEKLNKEADKLIDSFDSEEKK